MISHIVLFKPGAAVGPAEKVAILENLATAVAQCSTVRGCRVGRRVRHGLPGYEAEMREDYQYALILEFDDLAGLEGYLRHPAHERIAGVFTSAADASLAYDYELEDLAGARRLL